MNAPTPRQATAPYTAILAPHRPPPGRPPTEPELCKLITVGYTNGLTPTAINNWAYWHGGPHLRDALTDRHRWNRLTTKVTDYLSGSSNLAGGANPTAARLLLRRHRRECAALLHALVWLDSTDLDVNAAVVAAYVMCKLADDPKGWDTLLLPAGHVGVAAGWSTRRAQAATRAACERKLIQETVRRAGRPLRVRVPAPAGYSSTSDLVGADIFAIVRPQLADGSSMIAAIFRSVTHPAWGYSGLVSHRDWFNLLRLHLTFAGVAVKPPATRRRSERTPTARGADLVACSTPTELAALLDELAAVSGAVGVRDAAEVVRAEVAAARTAEVAAARVRRHVDALIAYVGDPGGCPADERSVWAATAQGWCQKRVVRPTADRLGFAMAVGGVLQSAGWPSAAAVAMTIVLA